jgi:hypothetical protein
MKASSLIKKLARFRTDKVLWRFPAVENNRFIAALNTSCPRKTKAYKSQNDRLRKFADHKVLAKEERRFSSITVPAFT